MFQPEHFRAMQGGPCEEQQDSAPSGEGGRGRAKRATISSHADGSSNRTGKWLSERMMENVDPSAGAMEVPIKCHLKNKLWTHEALILLFIFP